MDQRTLAPLDAFRGMWVGHYRLAVFMDKASNESAGGILLIDKHVHRWNFGTVVAVGKEIAPSGPAVGDKVAVWGREGVSIEDPVLEDGPIEGVLRVFGVSAPYEGTTFRMNPFTAVVGVVIGDEIVKPYGKNLILARDEMVTQTAGGILLPEDAQYRECLATISAVGPDVSDEYEVGMRVAYDPRAVKDRSLNLKVGERSSYCICDENAILYVIHHEH